MLGEDSFIYLKHIIKLEIIWQRRSDLYKPRDYITHNFYTNISSSENNINNIFAKAKLFLFMLSHYWYFVSVIYKCKFLTIVVIPLSMTHTSYCNILIYHSISHIILLQNKHLYFKFYRCTLLPFSGFLLSLNIWKYLD